MSGHLCARRTDGADPAYHLNPAYCPACQDTPRLEPCSHATCRAARGQLERLTGDDAFDAVLVELAERDVRRAHDRRLILTSLVLPILAAIMLVYLQAAR